MKATEAKLLPFLKKSTQFVIPIYQRTYAWTEKECLQLWDDVLRTGSDDAISVHFVGSIVYIEAGLGTVTLQPPLLVIDGQQRLTTLTLLLAALAEVLGTLPEDDAEPVEGFSRQKLVNYYLLNQEEKLEKRYKLVLSQTDKSTLIAIVQSAALPAECSVRVVQNHQLFRDLICEQKDSLITLCKGLSKLVIVDIALNRETDNPQLIFESMNSTGRKLSQADLIRNYILMGLNPDDQSHLYEHYWRQMEIGFGQEAYGLNFDGFMRHYLTVKNEGVIPKLDEIYENFKVYYTKLSSGVNNGPEYVVRDIRDFAKYYCATALNKEVDTELRSAFSDLRELKVDVAFPFLLALYHDYDRDRLSKVDFLNIVRLIESYVFRRSVCGITPNSMNKTFANFHKHVDQAAYFASVVAQFSSMPSYRRFPLDDEFHRDLMVRDLYNFPRKTYWLRRLENHQHKEPINVQEYTVEHILPQNEDLSKAWRDELGDDWQRIQRDLLHTLGNLTLTGYNSEYGDRPFAEKQTMAGGFQHSHLKLNAGLGQIVRWDEAAIRERAESLAEIAAVAWAALPVVGSHVPKVKKSAVKTYTMKDHPHIDVGGPFELLFESLRREILALDSCVVQEYYKVYIAFKAEKNFVDVEPQLKRLWLALNMPFDEIDDPKGLCKDVTNLGHMGNGDVQVALATLDDLPYVMGLVRQSFERQMIEDVDR